MELLSNNIDFLYKNLDEKIQRKKTINNQK